MSAPYQQVAVTPHHVSFLQMGREREREIRLILVEYAQFVKHFMFSIDYSNYEW